MLRGYEIKLIARLVQSARAVEYPWYDIKQSDGEAPVMLELWGMWSTLSLPSLPSTFWPGVVAPDRVLSMRQIILFNIKTVYFLTFKPRANEWLMFNRIAWNRTACHLTVVNKWLMFNWIISIE